MNDDNIASEHLISQLNSSVEFLRHQLSKAKTPEEKQQIERELSEAEDQLGRMQVLNG